MFGETSRTSLSGKETLGLWTYREFQKEKLRVRERYWRPFSAETLPSSLLCSPSRTEDFKDSTLWVIPDGVVWRKFLSLLIHCADLQICKLILLESAVDLMDYRNMTPSLQVSSTSSDCNSGNENDLFIPESSAPRERNKIQQLVRDHPNAVIPFCDLSVRDDECYDEWNLMKYSEMTIVERSQHALIRAGRIIEQFIQDHSTDDEAEVIDSNATTRKVVILASNQNFLSHFSSETDDNHDSILGTVLIDDFVNFLAEHDQEASVEKWNLLKERCEQEYHLRNAPPNEKDAQYLNDAYLSEEQIQNGILSGALFKGRLHVTKENPKEASVSVVATGAGTGKTYFINQQLGHFNRSFHHDIVVIEPLPQAQWGRPIGRRRIVHQRDNMDGDEDIGTVQESLSNPSSLPPVPSAHVVAIVSKSRRLYVATMVDMPLNDESAILVTPMDIRIPKIRIKTSGWRKLVKKRLLIEVDGWEVGSNYPNGHCVEILGPIADLETEISCLLHENEVVLQPFSAAALACLPPDRWTIPKEEFENRRDLRASHRIFSVDPPGCQDIDDTMHAHELPNGDIEVGVHIADVTHFVPHNSALDKEAQNRGTTFYLVDRRFDMLPSLLSSDLCSLHGHTDRLAVSVIWTLSKDFQEIKSVWYGRTVIHNFQAMTYDQAHNIIHNKPPDDRSKPEPPPLTAGGRVDSKNIKVLKEDLAILTNLARKLRKDREESGGAVDLSSGDLEVGRELKFTLGENNNPTRVVAKKELEIHHTIAEMMIFANSAVATKIHDTFPDRALLRVHRSVDEGRFDDLKEVLEAGKIAFDGSSNMALAASLKRAESASRGGSGAVVNSLFRSLATRAMSEAQYVSTGDIVAKEFLSHYGLGLEKYTHFTSPIRRYADVIVHKQLLLALLLERQQSGGPSTNHDSTSSRNIQQILSVPLPGSSAISILAGEGLQSVPRHDIEGSMSGSDKATKDAHQVLTNTSLSLPQSRHWPGLDPYNPSQVSRICEGLNRHNRLAKLSSMECQSLFLSLYFKDHAETTRAVVTSLKENGFWAYVPKFDMRGPVFVCDADGNLQIDPTLVGHQPAAGTAPTLGFAASGTSRMFATGKCVLEEYPDDRLVITVPDSPQTFVVRTLDVVSVRICCDSWDVRARVPSPRLHLVSESTSSSPRVKGAPTTSTRIDSQTLRGSDDTIQRPPKTSGTVMSLYEAVSKLEIPPVLRNVPLRCESSHGAVTDEAKTTIMAGRLIFGDFVNPDTRSATQTAAIQAASEAAVHRRAQMVAKEARESEYGRTRRIEREVTARAQRLAAGKRNARKSKAK